MSPYPNGGDEEGHKFDSPLSKTQTTVIFKHDAK